MTFMRVIQIPLGLNPACGLGAECVERVAQPVDVSLLAGPRWGKITFSPLAVLNVETREGEIHTEDQ